jgi:hypothetical protein
MIQMGVLAPMGPYSSISRSFCSSLVTSAFMRCVVS